MAGAPPGTDAHLPRRGGELLELAASARKAGCLLENPGPGDRGRITGGSFFLVRKSPADWTHTGIVTGVTPEAFCTIEGNTNDVGSSEGDGVYKRTRGYGRCDFILIPQACFFRRGLPVRRRPGATTRPTWGP